MTDNQDQPAQAPPPAYYAAYPYPENNEDEINLLDLFLVLLKHKLMIITMVLIAGAGAVTITLLMPNIYRSEATITLRSEEKGASVSLPSALGGLGAMVAGEFGLGGGSSLEKLEILLKTRILNTRVIKKHDLMPLLFPKKWNKEKKAWIKKRIDDKPPTIQDGIKIVQRLLTVGRDKKKDTITVGFDNPDPETAKKIAEYYLAELSEILREEVLEASRENQHFLKEQLEKTSDALLKEKIYALLAKEIEKETFALAQKYYGFVILDPPIAPDMDKKVKPKRSLICILSVFIAFFTGVFLSFILEFKNRIKSEDPERYNAVVKSITFWKRK